jgi:hypothetical protein
MPRIGNIAEFDGTLEDWPTYVDRFELYCAANGIKDDQKKACLLTQMGAKTYGLLQSLVTPAKPVDKTFADIVETLTKHLAPKRLVIGERFRFYKRDQTINETTSDYVAQLKKLTQHCKFGNALDSMRRDRFVCGVRSDRIADQGEGCSSIVKRGNSDQKKQLGRDRRDKASKIAYESLL